MSATAIKVYNDGDCTVRTTERGRRTVSSLLWRDHDIDLSGRFALASGEDLDDPVLRIRIYGPAGAPLIIAAGGISAGRRVADAGAENGWWRDLARFGGAIDVGAHQILGFDFLPGAEALVRTVTPADQARALAVALDTLDFSAARAFVGASYGGFIGLAFASLFPDRLEKLAVISAAARPDPMTTAMRGVQRRIISLGLETGREKEGVALARQLAMTTYRTADEFSGRFRAEPQGPNAGDPFDVCQYLIARGRAYAEAMPAARYLTLSDSLDRANVDPSTVTAQCLFIAASSDRLVPARDSKETAAAVRGPSDFHQFDSLVGHDAFLCEPEKYAGRLKAFLEA